MLTSTDITAENRLIYAQVMGKFDEFFEIRTNVILERAKFNRRNQLDGETAETYITVLYGLVENCKYGVLKDEKLRDRIVVGIRDQKLSETLQLDAGLTLEKAKKAARQREAVREQKRELEGDKKEDLSVEAMGGNRQGSRFWKKPRPQPRPPHTGGGASGAAGGALKGNQCTRCGYQRHQRGARCPAIEGVCYSCGKIGHFGAVCLSKRASLDDTTLDATLDSAFLDAVSDSQQQPWMATILIGQQHDVQFKLNTGAEVTAINLETFKKLQKVQLHKASKALYGPARQRLKVAGQCVVPLTHEKNTSEQLIFVVEDLKTNLLGLPAIKSLQLLQRLCATTTSSDIKEQYPKVFNGLGTLGAAYEIKLKDDAQPYALYAPRSAPMPLQPQVQEELNRMEAMGVIEKVTEPTPWVAGMVVVPKKSGSIRICVDLKPLNESVRREIHPIPKVDETLAQLTGARVFSKLDANSGFWQIPLEEKSKLLTTFVTPFGRYCFNKLPFGISSAPELFQRRMNAILEGLEGCVDLIDDILIFGKDQAEHDTRLHAALKRLQEAKVTLNGEKCAFSRRTIKFLGHVIDENGIRADPDKSSAISEMEVPKTITELQRFMGMVNQLGKFSPNLSDLSQPLRELLSPKNAWVWGPDQEKAFSLVKQELVKPTLLALYDPQTNTKVSADASSFGLGAVLLQQHHAEWRPVAYASRAMSETERRYAQIEKEVLAATWACEKFSDYILGRTISIESDHKPLIPLLNTKSLNALPPRILRFRLRLDRFSYTVHHVPGKLLNTADALSRAPGSRDSDEQHVRQQDEIEAFISTVVIPALPAGSTRLEVYLQAQDKDKVCSMAKKCCRMQWAPKERVELELAPLWKARGSFTIGDNLLLYNGRIVVPHSMWKETMEKIHEGHQGIERCQARVKASVWWPGINHHISQMVQQYETCCKTARPRKEPLQATPLPDYPFQMVGTDLFELKGVHYLLTVDYFSRYPEVTKLVSTTSSSIITALKAVFSRHGIPEVVRSDNGPQYSSHEFAAFAKSYGFKHATSSPLYPQSNGQAERTVKTIKQLISQSNDPYLTLMTYRATPLPWCDLSPSELCMGRKIRTPVPQTDHLLVPEWSYLPDFRERNAAFKGHQKKNFDMRHGVHTQPDIPDDTEVWINSGSEPVRGTVLTQANAPRSYVVRTPSGVIRRNRQHLSIVPQTESSTQ